MGPISSSNGITSSLIFTPHPNVDITEFLNDFEDECKIEFIDPFYLTTNTLDSEQAALEYFYQSPFYLKHRDKALNELLRAGNNVDPLQVGLIFQVTWSNLDELHQYSINYTMDNPSSRSQFYIMASTFHITLFSRELGHNDVQNTPIKVYYIIQGSIFMCPPFGSLVRNKLYNSIREFEKFYDKLNGISSWSITNGYTWDPKPRRIDEKIEELCNRYGFKDYDEEYFIKDGNMNIFHIKPQDQIAIRIVTDELRKLNN